MKGQKFSTSTILQPKVKEIHVGSEKEIRAVCVLTEDMKGEVYGLRFYDDEGKIVSEEIFDKRIVATWQL